VNTVNKWEAEWNATAIMKYGQRKFRPKRKTALEKTRQRDYKIQCPNNRWLDGATF